MKFGSLFPFNTLWETVQLMFNPRSNASAVVTGVDRLRCAVMETWHPGWQAKFFTLFLLGGVMYIEVKDIGA